MTGTGAKKDAFDLYGKESGLGGQYASQALGLNSVVAPAATAEMINPQGFNPTTLGEMKTSALQSAGGSNAGAAGSAGLKAARTRNIGSGQAATADASRAASERLSDVNTGIDTLNAKTKIGQQKEGQDTLGKMYGEDVEAGNNALGLANNAVKIAGDQKPGYWQQFGQTYGNDVLNNLMTAGAKG